MGGSHKKKQRAEKAKVKLKGVQLPKGLNVTKTEFKVRKITIRQQQTDEPKFVEGQRIINVKDALNRLKYNSVSHKLESLRNLREAIENNQQEVQAYRAAIVQGLSAMCLEIEYAPRRESLRTLAALLKSLNGTDEITPFFHIISSHLRCAMTHITQALQEDSLLLLDVLLKYCAQQVAADSSRILQNFLEMISRVRADGDEAGRTLVVHMKNSQTSVKWRSRVLERLQQMFLTMVQYNEEHNEFRNAEKPKVRIQSFNVHQPQYYSLKRVPAIADHSMLFSTTFNPTIIDTLDGLVQKETTALRTYIEHLMPLLLASWIEVRPNLSASKTLLNSDAATTLKIVLDIMQSLWKLVEKHEVLVKHTELSAWFRQQYATSFDNIFMEYFSFEQISPTLKRSKNATNKSNDQSVYDTQSCLRQNLIIVQLMCLFHKTDAQHKFQQVLAYVINIVKNLKANNCTTVEECQSLMLALRALLLHNVKQLLQTHGAYVVQLLRCTIDSYLQHNFTQANGTASDILVMLCEIAECKELFDAYGGQAEFEALLQQLPLLLLKPNISERALLAMTRLAKQQNTTFLAVLETQVAAIIENIQRIQVSNAANSFEGRKHIINLFYWTTRSWRNSKTELHNLLQLIDKSVTDKRIISYFQFVLT